MQEQKQQQEKEKSAPKQEATQPALPPYVTNEIDEIMRRIRLLEERFSNLRKKSQFTEQNMLKDTKELFEGINLLEANLTDMRSEISELNEKLLKLIDEMKQSVKKTDLNVLSKYLDFWRPLDFITREEAEKMLKETKKNQ